MINKFNKTDLIHFVGIGGIGMSGIAELMNNLGYSVQGSDISTNENIIRLKNKGIKILFGHKNSNIKDVNILVISSAIKKNNIEIYSAIKKRLPVLSRAEMLGELMRLKRGIAVAGSHGKTTTTSILGSILQKAKLDPTIVNGGIIKSLSTNSRMGNGQWMIAEADESDGSFLFLPKEINIITNIDKEHLDHYKNFNKLFYTFKKFSSDIPFYGSSIICLENKNCNKLIKEITTREVLTYGINKPRADLNIFCISYKNNKSFFTVVLSDKIIKTRKRKYDFVLSLIGKHNILNSTAAIAASLKIGIKIPTIQKTLANFKGVERRFTFIKRINNIKIYDDYAHHPEEIKASLDIAKKICKGKIVVVFQPHRYSRTNLLFKDFINILKDIDVVILTKIYSAGEKKIKNLDKKLFTALKKNSTKIVLELKKESMITSVIKPYLIKDNIIIFMGAGTISNWAKKFVLNYRG